MCLYIAAQRDRFALDQTPRIEHPGTKAMSLIPKLVPIQKEKE
jgi:hypothetical protein